MCISSQIKGHPLLPGWATTQHLSDTIREQVRRLAVHPDKSVLVSRHLLTPAKGTTFY